MGKHRIRLIKKEESFLIKVTLPGGDIKFFTLEQFDLTEEDVLDWKYCLEKIREKLYENTNN